jgi:hypothetical protein
MGAIPNNDWSEEVNGWIDISKKEIEKRHQAIDQGKADQSTYTGLAGWLDYLGLSKFLRNDTIAEVRQAFSKSAECIETSFRMAYDERHPKYLGEKVDLTEVEMQDAIDGFHAALLAADFEAGKRLAVWAQIPSDEIDEAGNPKHSQSLVANYMHALKYIFLGDDTKALEYARATETWFAKKGEPTKNRFHRNFFHRCRLVRAILEKNPDLFEASMKVQLKSHAWEAVHDDIADTPEAYIYVDGVALCNLAFHKGMKINFEAGVIPEGLLPEFWFEPGSGSML